MPLADAADTQQGREATAEPVLGKSQLSGRVFQQEGLSKPREQKNLRTKTALCPVFALFKNCICLTRHLSFFLSYPLVQGRLSSAFAVLDMLRDVLKTLKGRRSSSSWGNSSMFWLVGALPVGIIWCRMSEEGIWAARAEGWCCSSEHHGSLL